MKFLDVRTDYAFKKVFGVEENKSVLMDFLNAVISFPHQEKITDLTIVDPYNIPVLKGMKDSFLDVKAILNTGEKVIIEMQVLNHKGFEKRVLYNAAKNYSVQLNKSDDYHLLNPVIGLNIVDFDMFPESPSYIKTFGMVEKEELIDYSGDIALIFIELPKFKKKLEELTTIQDRWIYFIKNAGSLEIIPKGWDEEFTQAFTTINEANLSQQELEIQHKRKEFISIQKSALQLAIETGLEEGEKKGLAKGLEEGLKEGEKKGLEKGIEKGKAEGLAEGKKEGLEHALQAMVHNGMSEREAKKLLGL